MQNVDWSYFSKRYFQGSFKSFPEVPKLPENEEGGPQRRDRKEEEGKVWFLKSAAQRQFPKFSFE